MSSPAPERNHAPLQAENDALRHQVRTLGNRVTELERQLQWFQRQLFGQKSEKRTPIDPAVQPSLLAGQVNDPPPDARAETTTYTVHRRKKQRHGCVNDTGLRFDATVPVRVIDVPVPEGHDSSEVLSTHSTFRLAQRRASYEILEYRVPVLRQPDTAELHTTPVPGAIFEGSVADVSFLAGLLIDKFAFHLPLYRQHQRLAQAGVTLSRATLTGLVARAASLLAPIHQAQLAHVLQGRVLAMDETPIKVGRRKQGKLHQAYFWPLYGEDDEVSFTFSDTRAKAHIEAVLGDRFHGTLITDGYSAYRRYAESKPSVTHAQCWVHMRRTFERAKDSDPQAAEGLALIGRLYHQEATIRKRHLEGADKQQARTRQEEPIVRAFWRWCDQQCQRLDLEPTHPLAKALRYALDRQAALNVFLSDPDVPLDTNHLERALRPIPIGRRSWLFCWTEVGARYVGIIQSLITTCRLHGVDPYTYLVDVLQRVQDHPAKRVEELTPRAWKRQFADHPLRSDIERFTSEVASPAEASPAPPPPATEPTTA